MKEIINNNTFNKQKGNISDPICITVHQLKSSISGLKWILKIIIDGEAGKLTNNQNKLFKKVYAKIEEMLLLVNNLLIQNNDNNMKINYNYKKNNYMTIINETILEFSSKISKEKMNLIFMKPKTLLPFVFCDKKMIKIVLQNLIENAIKYNKKGKKIFIHVQKKDNKIITAIKDFGIGIKPKDKDKIFKKFYRAKNALAKDADGTGLGLFTSNIIINDHKGKMWFENPKEGGTIFFFSLPI